MSLCILTSRTKKYALVVILDKKADQYQFKDEQLLLLFVGLDQEDIRTWESERKMSRCDLVNQRPS